VTWDHGGSNSYRMGAEGKYDLKMAAGYDTSNTSEPVASGTSVLSGKSATSSASKFPFQTHIT
jgi:E3 ubiquitin-protein ligase HECTD1